MHGLLGMLILISLISSMGNSYNNDERVIAAGYDNGDLKLFDLKTN